jgi:hypothetical protein
VKKFISLMVCALTASIVMVGCAKKEEAPKPEAAPAVQEQVAPAAAATDTAKPAEAAPAPETKAQ